jgi:hypothetical protein
MNRAIRSAALAAGLLVSGGVRLTHAADDAKDAPGPTPVTSRISAASLFKNGLAIVERKVTLPGQGSYALDLNLRPAHGTLWIDSKVPVLVGTAERAVKAPRSAIGGSLAAELAGRTVTLHFRNEKRLPVSGKVEPLARPMREPGESEAAWEIRAEAVQSRFIALKMKEGKRIFIEPGDISSFESDGLNDTVTQLRPVTTLTIDRKVDGPVEVTVSYIAKGLSWAPAYRIDTANPKRLRIEQSAVVRNELERLSDSEVLLITGFPGVAFGNVLSPLSRQQGWDAFFGGLNQADGAYQTRGRRQMMAQQVASNAVFFNDAQEGPDFNANLKPGGEGGDLHFQSIGNRSINVGEAINLSVGASEADYRRVVEWKVPDRRDDYGRYQNPGAATDEDDPWDALEFKNPFNFPLTTAPASIMTGGRFGGQCHLQYTSPGEQTTVRVNKALTIRAKSVENEESPKGDGQSERDFIMIGGTRYRRATVVGELKLTSFRKDPTTIQIRRRFSGDLVKADDNPKITLLEEGVFSANKRNELRWEVTVKGGEVKVLNYRYTVLVNY